MKKSLSNNNLLIVGSVAYDSIQTPFGKVQKELGGSASYFSLASRLFAPTSLLAVVGDDFKNIGTFKKHSVDISGLEQKKGKTFHWAGKYHFDLNTRDTLKTELGVFQNFNPKLGEKHKNAGYVFLGNIHPSLQLKVLKQIKNPKLVGLDTMNYWIEKTPRQLKQVLGKIGALIINEGEARQLSDEFNLVKAAKKILKMMSRRPLGVGIPTKASGGDINNPILIIKQGEHGLLMFHQGDIFNLPGYPLENVIDPTGAGDSFAGGFMGYLAKMNKINPTVLKQACVYGSVVASFCVEKFGTRRLQEIGAKMINGRFNKFTQLTKFNF